MKKPNLLRLPEAGRLHASRSKAFKAAAECRNERHCGHLGLFDQTII